MKSWRRRLEEVFEDFWVVEKESEISEWGEFEEEVYKRLQNVFSDLKKEEMSVDGTNGVVWVEVKSRGVKLSFNEEANGEGEEMIFIYTFYGVEDVREEFEKKMKYAFEFANDRINRVEKLFSEEEIKEMLMRGEVSKEQLEKVKKAWKILEEKIEKQDIEIENKDIEFDEFGLTFCKYPYCVAGAHCFFALYTLNYDDHRFLTAIALWLEDNKAKFGFTCYRNLYGYPGDCFRDRGVVNEFVEIDENGEVKR